MRTRTLLASMALGAGAMYFLDSVQGKRRRALLRDKVIAGFNDLEDAIDTTSRDLRNRVNGLLCEVESAMHADQEVPDRVLEARVRSQLGRSCSHPHGIEVTAHSGHVTLRGPILTSEVANLLSTVQSVSGVKGVDNQLTAHETPENIPELQGGTTRVGQQSWFLQHNWPPAMRLAMGTAGLLLMTRCVLHRTFSAAVLGTLGFGTFVRAATNVDVTRLLGATTRAVRIPRPALPVGQEQVAETTR